MKIYDFDNTLFETSELHKNSFKIFIQKLADILYLQLNGVELDIPTLLQEAKFGFKGEADPVVFQKIFQENPHTDNSSSFLSLLTGQIRNGLDEESIFVSYLSLLRQESLLEAYNSGTQVKELRALSQVDSTLPIVVVTSNYESVVGKILSDRIGTSSQQIIVFGNETLLSAYRNNPESIIPSKPDPFLLNQAVKYIREGLGYSNDLIYVGDSKTDIAMVREYRNQSGLDNVRDMGFELVTTPVNIETSNYLSPERLIR